jgi:hypothetical protein
MQPFCTEYENDWRSQINKNKFAYCESIQKEKPDMYDFEMHAMQVD